MSQRQSESSSQTRGASFALGELAERLGAKLVGDADSVVTGLAPLGSATPEDLSHLSSPAYLAELPSSQAGAVLVRSDHADDVPNAALIVDDPYVAYARASQLFDPRRLPTAGIHPTAIIEASASVDESAYIGPYVVIGADCRIAAGCVLHAHSTLGDRCELAESVVLHAGVRFVSDVHVGARSVFHSGVVIGAEGFGFARAVDGRQVPIAQLGGVTIGADVSVGAGSMIDCGALEDTVIEDGVKIDNLVQIGHNCRVGAHSVLCGTVAIAGSSTIGRYCVLAGGSGVGGDKPVSLCDGVVLTARTVASRSIKTPGFYAGGTLFTDAGRWKRNAIRFDDLDGIARRLRASEKALAQIKDALEQKPES